MNNLVYVDVESTGLTVGVHQVWEIAYAVNDGPITEFQVEHNLVNADLEALRINNYLDRVDSRHHHPGHNPDTPYISVEERIFRDSLLGNHLIASNPDFDSRMLAERWGCRPWHHRMIDLAPMGMVHFAWGRPKGIKDIAEALRAEGYTIPQPDHTAAGDVATLRACYEALTTGL